MALYNLTRDLDRQRFKARINALYKKGQHCQQQNGDLCVVEVIERKPPRSNKQNAYLHLLLRYLAMQCDETTDYVKEEYYKKICNRELFVVRHYDKLTETYNERLRSSSTLTTDEMTLSIERLRNWAAQHGYYLPDPNDEAQMVQAQQELYYNAQFIELQ